MDKKVSKRQTKKLSNKTETRYYVKSDGRIVTAYKKENAPGYFYKKRSSEGVRNVGITGTTYKTEKEARSAVAARVVTKKASR
jgi:hypothetical protein